MGTLVVAIDYKILIWLGSFQTENAIKLSTDMCSSLLKNASYVQLLPIDMTSAYLCGNRGS